MEMELQKKKRAFKLPHVFVIMLLLMLFVSILTYVVPSGTYTRVESDTSPIAVVDPDSYTRIENSPVTPWDYFTSIYRGFVEGATIMGSLILVSGALEVLQSTGTFAAAIQKLIHATRGKELLVVIVFYVIFTIFGVLGYGEAAYPFYPLVVAVFMSMGYDRMVGTAVCMFASTVGFTSGLFNLFTTGISQQIVGLPLYSGIGFRTVGLAVYFAIGLFFLVRYCRQIRRDPSKSYMREEFLQQKSKDVELQEAAPLTGKMIISLLLFLVIVVLQGFCAIQYGWGLAEISALYIIYAIVLVVLFRVKLDDACQSFIKGSSKVLGAALVIGLARSVMILLTQGNIIDTFVKGMADLLTGKSPAFTMLIIFGFVTLFNFFVVSGSGKAVMMMPILNPLGHILGINQQVLVLTYQYGDGLTNCFWPAGAMPALALCGVNYGDWFKFCWKAYVCFIASGYGLVLLANALNVGPF
ncbi:TIGR00366 family protein [Oscillospiraceae bacterium OttesenSCG-928-G22]|nr:TIGR00366 family protein [Oscillospiraceae bacterium OttesenSCG-928-G22]